MQNHLRKESDMNSWDRTLCQWYSKLKVGRPGSTYFAYTQEEQVTEAWIKVMKEEMQTKWRVKECCEGLIWQEVDEEGWAKETQWEERSRVILDRFIKTKNAKNYTAAKRAQSKGWRLQW